MATKVYTAQEMRLTAEYMHYDYAFALIPVSDMPMIWRKVMSHEVQEMLRQAADALEREERREKKHEYKVLYRRRDGRMYDSIGHTEDIETAREIMRIYVLYKDAHIVRREVGEWEEVKDGK